MSLQSVQTDGRSHGFGSVAAVFLYLGANAAGLGAAAWHFDSLRAWTVHGPLFTPVFGRPLLVSGGFVSELLLFLLCAAAARCLARCRRAGGIRAAPADDDSC